MENKKVDMGTIAHPTKKEGTQHGVDLKDPSGGFKGLKSFQGLEGGGEGGGREE